MVQIIPEIVVEGDISDLNYIEQRYCPQNVYIIGNFPMPEDIVTFKNQKDFQDYLAQWSSINPNETAAPMDNDLIKYWYRVLEDKNATYQQGEKDYFQLTNGLNATAVTLINIATVTRTSGTISGFTAKKLTPDVLSSVLQNQLVSEEAIDILAVTQPINDIVKTTNSTGPLYTSPELLKIYCDSQLKKKNFVMAQFALEGMNAAGSSVLNPNDPISVGQFLDVARKFGTPKTISRNGDGPLPTTENGGSLAICTQKLKTNAAYAGDNPTGVYELREVNAILTGLLGGRNVSTSIVHLSLPCFDAVDPDSVYDFKAPSEIDAGCGDGYKLLNAGLTLFKNGARSSKDCLIVNSLSPGITKDTDPVCPKQGQKVTQNNLRFNISHLLTRNSLINQMKLATFLGRPRILSAFDDLAHECTDVLSKAVENEVLADYELKVAKSKIDPERVDVKITMVVYGVISKIVLSVALTMDGIAKE